MPTIYESATSSPRTSVRVFTFILLTLATLTSYAGTRITLQLGNAPGRDVLLAHYYGTSVYVDDTLRTDAQGRVVIAADTLLPQGLYMIYIDKDRRFDFMLGADQEFTLQSRSGRGDDLVIEGAAETKAFQDYTHWFRRQQARRNGLDSILTKTSGSARDSVSRQISQMVTEVNNYWKSTAAKFPGSLLASFLMANYYEELKPEDIPAAWQANDSLKWTYQYNYRKENWFGHFNLADERLLYTPLVKNRLDSFFGQVLLQMYDSVKPPVYNLLRRAEPHPKMFRYMVSQLLNSSLNSTVMGMDALFVDLARDFYLSGKATWADSATMAKIRENVIFLENNLVGKPARDVQMEQFEGEPFRLYQQSNRFTILAFYEPGCSHCREYIPALFNEVYLKYRDKGVEVVAGYTMADRAEWAKFLEQHQLHDWINVWDPNHLSRFKILYDTRVTPSVYLLDKDKKIIAKKFTIEFLHEYFKHYLK